LRPAFSARKKTNRKKKGEYPSEEIAVFTLRQGGTFSAGGRETGARKGTVKKKLRKNSSRGIAGKQKTNNKKKKTNKQRQKKNKPSIQPNQLIFGGR